MTAQLRPALVLSAWTLLVWTTRIRNVWSDGDLSTGAQVGRTTVALAFTAFALVTIVAALRTRGGDGWSALPMWVRAFALWTVGVWVVRGVQIALADHGAAFIAVHTALAIVSIGLAVWADRALTTSRLPRPEQSEAVRRSVRRSSNVSPPHTP